MEFKSKLALLILALVCKTAGLFYFVKGFFPYKAPMKGKSTYETLIQDSISISSIEDIPVPRYDKLVIMVVDALRNDFVFGQSSSMAFTRNLLKTGKAKGYTARASVPTVTMPRIRALTTGIIPGYTDAVLNLIESYRSSDEADKQDDSIIWQFVNSAKKNVYMFGDDTWLRLFPGSFKKHEGTTSFYVQDTVEVDFNVTRHLDLLFDDKSKSDMSNWDVLILHYLGLDHIGHLEGPGDHGMNEIGNHGGNSEGETSPAMVFASPSMRSKLPMMELGTVQQIDLVSSLSMLLGIPIPQNNVGVPIKELFETYSDNDLIKIYELSALQVRKVVQTSLGNSGYTNKDIAGTWDIRKCDLLSKEIDILECKFLSSRNQHLKADKATKGEISIGSDQLARLQRKVVENYKNYCEQAYKAISSNFSGYNLNFLITGIFGVLASLGVLITSQFWAIAGGFPISNLWQLKNGKSPAGSFLGYYLIFAISLLSISAFSTSFIEEEHLVWFYLCQTLLVGRFFSLVVSQRARDNEVTKSVIMLVLIRIVRGWNNLGIKWAEETKSLRLFLLQESSDSGSTNLGGDGGRLLNLGLLLATCAIFAYLLSYYHMVAYPKFVTDERLCMVTQSQKNTRSPKVADAGTIAGKKGNLIKRAIVKNSIALKEATSMEINSQILLPPSQIARGNDEQDVAFFTTIARLQRTCLLYSILCVLVYKLKMQDAYSSNNVPDLNNSSNESIYPIIGNLPSKYYQMVAHLLSIARMLFPTDLSLLCKLIYLTSFISAGLGFVLKFYRPPSQYALHFPNTISTSAAFHLDLVFSTVPVLVLVSKLHNAFLVAVLLVFILFGVYTVNNGHNINNSNGGNTGNILYGLPSGETAKLASSDKNKKTLMIEMAKSIGTHSVEDGRFMAILLFVAFRFIHFAFGNTNSLSSFDLSSAYLGIEAAQPQDLLGSVIYKGLVLTLTLSCNFSSIILLYLGAGAIFSSYPESEFEFDSGSEPEQKITSGGTSKNNKMRKSHSVNIGGLSKLDAILFINGIQTVLLLGLFIATTILRSHLFVWTVFAPKVLYTVALEIINLGLSLFILAF